MFSHSMEEEKKGWDEAHCAYRCADDTVAATERRESRVLYPETWSCLSCGVFVAGAVYDRGLVQLSWLRDRPRTIAFPRSVRVLDRGLTGWNYDKEPRGVCFNEGLEEVAAECLSSSGVVSVHIPASVRSVGDRAFSNCEQLSGLTIAENAQGSSGWSSLRAWRSSGPAASESAPCASCCSPRA